ncbi:methyltransferase domain-containing protein [Candidatus Micrarchaeota archaeon]|nr:methyltransferase domain-containing protein [Candidatus Micrarchaeota archaeon]
MKLKEIREAGAKILVPDDESVFYNPRMAFNRTLSSLALGAALPHLKSRHVLDGFCATGIRGIRYALENPLDAITFLDANPRALELARKNAEQNHVQNAEFACDEFNHFCTQTKPFDVVEVDPFGTPAPFIQNALRACHKKAILSVTATDLATLCGRKNQPAQRRYDAAPLYVDFAHELALRIILGFVARQAAMQDAGITPLFSFYQDHFAKIMVLVEKSAQKADESLTHIGHVHFDPETLARDTKPLKCKNVQVAGPLWVSDVNDVRILNAMKQNAPDEKTKHLLEVLENEQGRPPYFYDVHHVGKPAPKMDALIEKLRKKKFKATRTHYAPTGLKTDANIHQLRRIM